MDLQIESIDNKDWEIICELQRNGRASLVEIGNKVDLRHPSVKARLDKLIRRGLIRVQANINVAKLGYQLALIVIEVNELPKALDNLDKLRQCPKVVLIAVKEGDYNLLILVLYRKPGELKAFIEKRIRNIPGLRRLSVENSFLLKPRFLPCELGNLSAICDDECRTCEFKEEPFSCPGCNLGIK
ncbi:MAG: hypothetical protein B6U69_02805 [Thermofilum sp. ex4484_15]|nr:MAG: hypothetical protein B6U69_02805 [Thermofilum sp. ex4484_15]